MNEYACDWCGKLFKAREADRRRGWARCCGKSCAAKVREYKLDREGRRDRERNRRRGASRSGLLGALDARIEQLDDPVEFGDRDGRERGAF